MDVSLEKLQTELDKAYRQFSQAITQLDPDKRHQAGVSGAWSAQDVVSHLIGWDQALQAFIADPERFDPTPLYDVHQFNAQSVSDRQQQTWAETMDEWQRSYLALQQALTTVTTGMNIYGRVKDWLKGRRDDYAFHTPQIEAWIEQNRDGSR